MSAPECKARRPERGDGECSGAVSFAVVYRSRTGRVVERVAGCFVHALAEVERVHAAGTIARCDVEELRESEDA